MNPIDQLLAQRIVLLRGTIDDTVANEVIAMLLYLRSDEPSATIRLHLHSSGGHVAAALAIRDTMDDIPVATHCLVAVEGVAAVLLAHGIRGQRTVMPRAHVAFTPLSSIGESAALEIERTEAILAGMLAEDTGQSIETITADCRASRRFTAAEARAYGLVDHVVG